MVPHGGWIPYQWHGATHRALFVAAWATLVIFLSQQSFISAQGESSIEQQAQELDKKLICPICPGETLNQSQTDLARQMRGIIRDRLIKGQSEHEIITYFVSVYGQMVLAAPPKTGFSLTAWLVPPFILLVSTTALTLAVLRIKARSSLSRSVETNLAGAEGLESYLELIDAEMPDTAVNPPSGTPEGSGSSWRT